MIKKVFFLSMGLIFFSGCFVNERGISNRYYDDCKEYYDASGTYYKECPQNWIDLPLNPQDLKSTIKSHQRKK